MDITQKGGGGGGDIRPDPRPDKYWGDGVTEMRWGIGGGGGGRGL
jgi:hypothetical protein